VGYPTEINHHHQGGTTGYLSREVVATPEKADVIIETNTAVAWNPSLPGTKIEDTFIMTDEEELLLTQDLRWPGREVGRRFRPDFLVRP
jgi:hypothetical protein